MDDLQLIERYLKAELDELEEEKFVERIRSEPAFKKKVLTHTLMIKAILNVGRRQERAVRQSVDKRRMTWKRYILIYGVYGNYYFTGNIPRYNRIFANTNRTVWAQ